MLYKPSPSSSSSPLFCCQLFNCYKITSTPMCNIYKQQHPFMLGLPSLKVSHINQLWYHHNSFHKYVHRHHRHHHQNQQIVTIISSSKQMQEPEWYSPNFYISIIISLISNSQDFPFICEATGRYCAAISPLTNLLLLRALTRCTVP